MKRLLKKFIFGIRAAIFNENTNTKKILLIAPTGYEDKVKEIRSRLNFFDTEFEIEQSNNLSLVNKLNHQLIVCIGYQPSKLVLKIKQGYIFNMDYDVNYLDGWEYHRLLAKIEEQSIKGNRANIRAKLSDLKKKLIEQFNKVYIFGTGPSLEKAIDREWKDGIRIVSNTIVKDKELWNHINPHFIVAGDAIYHFGYAEFAKAFRRDLADRLAETDTYFVFPEHYLPFLKKELSNFHDRLLPIPTGVTLTFNKLIEEKFELPGVGNVLNSLLLPLSSYLSDNVYLWGFDGRAPNDKLFWKNSDKHFYTDLVPELQKLHPAFFNEFVPKDNPEKYVKALHGDALNTMIVDAEKSGQSFRMLHPSYTKTLMDRYVESES